MEIGFVQIARAQPVRSDIAQAQGPAVLPRDASRVPASAPTGLPTPFGTGREEAGAVRARLNDSEAQAQGRETRTELSEEDQAIVDQLAARDREVRNHEEAHARVGGQYAGEPSYTYQQGPDGNQYAVGGEVPIDIAPIDGDPEATITKMEIVKAAALAPAEPSGQDRRVAAVADAQRQQAIADLAELRRQTEPVEVPSFDIAA